MPKPTDALDYLAHPQKQALAPVVVLFGDEAFLKRRVLGEIAAQVSGGDDAAGAPTAKTFSGPDALWREVLDEVSTFAMFGDKRLVVVDEADDFVSRNRPALEKYVERSSPSGVLVLVADSWPSTTRLFKALAESGLQIECKFPAPAKLNKWLIELARKRQATLDTDAAELLIETVEPELGLFDQELAKLSALAGPNGKITAEMVAQAVGGWRTQTTWDMLDAAASGEAPEAMLQLERLLLAGEAPVAILGQIASTLRRFAAATRLIEQAEADGRRVTLRAALEEAGFKPFVLGKAEGQLRQIGRQRAGEMYRWLLATDLALKGSHSAPDRARLALEQLIVRLSKTAAPAASPR